MKDNSQHHSQGPYEKEKYNDFTTESRTCSVSGRKKKSSRCRLGLQTLDRSPIMHLGDLLDEQTKVTEEPPDNISSQIVNLEPNFEVED